MFSNKPHVTTGMIAKNTAAALGAGFGVLLLALVAIGTGGTILTVGRIAELGILGAIVTIPLMFALLMHVDLRPNSKR